MRKTFSLFCICLAIALNLRAQVPLENAEPSITNFISLNEPTSLVISPNHTYTTNNIYAQDTFIGIQDYSLLHKKSKMDTYNPMVVEGRTWWYDASFFGWLTEYGLRIGSSVVIDGQEWNKVFVCLHHKNEMSENSPYDTTYEWLEYDEDTGLLGYIREEERQVFFRSTSGMSFDKDRIPYNIMDNSVLFLNLEDGSPVKIYDFRGEESFVLGIENDDTALCFMVNDCDEESSHGNTYNRIKARTEGNFFVSPNEAFFTEGIGLTEFYGTTNTPQYSIFYAPYYMALTNGRVLHSLKYVTDSNDNIIYEATGGTMPWEQYKTSGVDTPKEESSFCEPEYFNLQGMKITHPLPGTVVIERTNGKSLKKLFN